MTGSKASVKVENLPAGTTATMLVVQYRDGQMIDMETQTVTANGTYSISGFSHKTSDTYKSFLLDENMKMSLCMAEHLMVG